MKRLFYILTSTLIFLASCQENKSNFVYDPSNPYPLLNPGDFWLDKFDQRGLQNAIVYRDKIYCNTIDVGGDGNYLYCLNPRNGLVIWRSYVDAYASQPASFQKDTVIYCSILGDIYAFNSGGKISWKAKFEYPYGGHWLDTFNSRLLVKTVHWKWVYEFNIKSGKLISKTESDSLQKLISIQTKNTIQKETYEFTFVRLGKKYTIECRPTRPDEMGEYKIEISK